MSLGLATILDADPVARATAIAARHRGEELRMRSARRKLLANHAHDLSVAEILIEESRAQHELIYSKNQLEAVMSQLRRQGCSRSTIPDGQNQRITVAS